MPDGVRSGRSTGESLGHLAFWLAKRCPEISDEVCKRILELEFPDRKKHPPLTIQNFAVYRNRSRDRRERIGIKSDKEAAKVLKRIDGKPNVLKSLFSKVSQPAAAQLQATLDSPPMNRQKNSETRKENSKTRKAQPQRSDKSSVIPAGYIGPELSGRLVRFLEVLVHDHGFTTGPNNRDQSEFKTFYVKRGSTKYGYIDPTVIGKKGVLGYHFGFGDFQSGANTCPPEMAKKIEKLFGRRYRCSAPDGFITYLGTNSSNQGRTLLTIMDESVALRVLLQEAGIGNADALASTPDALDELDEYLSSYDSLPETEREEVRKARIGQGRFRQDLVRYWRSCAVSGVTEESVLRASHIRPWRDSDNHERLNHFNGLLLAPNLDSLFDRGLVSFNDDGQILVSAKLSKEDRRLMGIHEGLALRQIDERHKEFLHLHRKLHRFD